MAVLTVKDLISLLQKEDPDAPVSTICRGHSGYLGTAKIEGKAVEGPLPWLDANTVYLRIEDWD